jgi:Uma2 family endonuclease
MSTALRQPASLEDFLEWERGQDLRYEFDGVQAVAMTGGTVAHSIIMTNVVRALQDRLQRSPCRAFHGDLKINANGRIRYPDALVVCSPIAQDADIVADSVVVFEVLSPSTARTDRVTKNADYQATPSIQHYVMLEQDAPAATVFSRSAEGWIGKLHWGEAAIPLPAIGVELPLRDVYAGVVVTGRPLTS